MAISKIDSDGITAGGITADSLDIGQIGGRRNLIINGAMQVAQRGDVNGIVMSGATNAYTAADRWCIGRANVGDTGTLDTTVTGGVLRLDVATADAALTSGSATSIRQIIEAQNCAHVSGQTVTLSFKFKTNKTGTYGVYLYGYDAASFVTPQSITVSTADTETSYTLTFTAPSSIARDNGEGIGVNITLAAHSSREGSWYPTGETQVNFMDDGANYCELSEVQLEVGSVATPFEHRSYGEELAACQRYCQQVNASGDFHIFAHGSTWSTGVSTMSVSVSHPVSMRAIPTLITSSASDFGVDPGNKAISVINLYKSNESVTTVQLTASSGYDAGTAIQFIDRDSTGNAYIRFDAEL